MALQVCRHHCLAGSEIRTRPFETCLFCAQKHLSSALALSSMDLTGRYPVSLRTASQVQLAAWHFGKTYLDEFRRCKAVIDLIFSLKDYQNELRRLVEISWDDLSISIKEFSDDEKILQESENTFKAGVLHTANSVELLKFERNYAHINFSYAVGQLVLANWSLQNFDTRLADRCREFYHDVELETIDISKLEKFRNKLWDKYLEMI